MADLSVIYKISADISGLQDGVNRAAKSAEGLETMAGRVGKALAGAFTVTALIGFGKELIATADGLQKMSDRTGIGVEGLQRLQAAGDDAGNSIEEMTSAINQMQNRLASGDKSAVSAIDALNLDLVQLKNLNPENQFIAISDAIRKIEDPARQVQLAMDLFGKSGAQILPTLKRGFDDLKGATVGMSEETVRALDEVGDTWTRVVRQVKGAAAEAIVGVMRAAESGFQPALQGVRDAAREAALELERLKKMADEARSKVPSLKLPTPFAASDPNSSANQRAERELERAHDKLGQAAKKAADEHQKLIEKLRELGAVLPGLKGNVTDLTDDIRDDVAAWKDLHQQLDQIERQSHSANFGFKGLADGLENLGEKVEPVKDLWQYGFVGPLQDVQKRAETFASFIKTQLGPSILAAIQGGGNIAKSIGGTIGGFLTGSTSAIGQGISKAVGKIGGGIGGVLGSVIPGLGTMIGSLAGGALGNLFGKLFGGVSADVKKARAMVADFEKAIGSAATATQKAEAGTSKWKLTVITVRDAYIATGKSAADAEKDVAAMWDSSRRGAEAARAAIDRVQQALDEANADQARAKELVEEYNIRTEDMGRAWNQAQLNDKVKGLMNDFRIMVQVLGMNAPDALRLMETKFNDLVKTAQETGLEIPANLKPVLQQMVDLGTLVDKDGNKVTDLKSLGITFAETFAQSVDRLIQRFDEFIDKLFGVRDAVDKIPDKKTIGIDFDVQPPRMPTIGDGFDFPRFPDVPSFAAGSNGFRDFGAGTPALLHGVEAVVPASEAGLGSRVISVGDIVVHMPPGTDVNDPHAFAIGFQRVLRYDVLGTLTGLENTIDKRVALAAGAVG